MDRNAVAGETEMIATIILAAAAPFFGCNKGRDRFRSETWPWSSGACCGLGTASSAKRRGQSGRTVIFDPAVSLPFVARRQLAASLYRNRVSAISPRRAEVSAELTARRSRASGGKSPPMLGAKMSDMSQIGPGMTRNLAVATGPGAGVRRAAAPPGGPSPGR
jgi:hypothetical protein